jgi:ribonuclease BN (tRNA processing enzyme)
MFRNSSKAEHAFSLRLVELTPGSSQAFEGTKVKSFLVEHSSEPSLALRIERAGKVISYTGDTEWAQSLIPVAHQADLLVAEAYFFEKKVRYHLDFRTLTSHMDELRPKRLIVTHMSEDMLARLDRLTCEYAEDGKTVQM